ncbi:tRNA (adenosine(37)-N6)-threonylcarbamoyltransferase complex ATPase subunit type 1 TsaE [Lentilactobacillus sp. Marseille-Q4993]|uniref:tRNA (adenosine(37)-N6)-threonylcarbamoyltransferase complex ATPase subunit type 1 TsaE n=1 Tax=Lentilactobacillus sp. Marseille-Q4993 TaxID=3039492 RepID=UPI0024BC00AB|nr:tRNA (adenosine(37)-N6)-threonylcarbamoyltransferase complex ATPase subunit type 1 TsaE [Lentilactobacillus sp. Marseille-Q4993]
MKTTVLAKSADQTIEIGSKLGNLLQPGDVLLLDGDLGAGKTTFTKGIGKALGIKRPVKSPTFTIIREYKGGRIPLYHMDVYRLEDGGGEELGLEEYFNGDGVTVVEWSEFIEDELPTEYLKIKFERLDNEAEDNRKIEFEGHGSRADEMIGKVVGE